MDDRVREEWAGLDDLAGLVLQVDDHPEARLELVAEAAGILEGQRPATEVARAALADRVERWRYQLINHRSGRLSAAEAELARRVDRLSHQVRGRGPRGPRSLRDALATAQRDDEVARCLDPGMPLDALEDQARAVTARCFSTNGGGDVHRTMLMYAPLYVSNLCINHCLYCGFRYPQTMTRERLDVDQAVAEAEVLGQRGFRHVLIVAGEYPRLITVDYLAGITSALASRGFIVGIEVAPQSTLGYERLCDAGAASVTLYQETYDEELYARYHPKGTKAWYDWRLEGPERSAEGGIGRVGLGVLLGLGDPRAELRALVAHGRYLLERFPGVSLSFGLPRIREAPEGFLAPWLIDDEMLVRLACGLRLAFPTAHLVLSTRESPALRDRLAGVCITQMSAGSSTSPGGYTTPHDDECDRQQFPVCDRRSPAEVVSGLVRRGFEVRWEFEPATH